MKLTTVEVNDYSKFHGSAAEPTWCEAGRTVIPMHASDVCYIVVRITISLRLYAP